MNEVWDGHWAGGEQHGACELIGGLCGILQGPNSGPARQSREKHPSLGQLGMVGLRQMSPSPVCPSPS